MLMLFAIARTDVSAKTSGFVAARNVPILVREEGMFYGLRNAHILENNDKNIVKYHLSNNRNLHTAT